MLRQIAKHAVPSPVRRLLRQAVARLAEVKRCSRFALGRRLLMDRGSAIKRLVKRSIYLVVCVLYRIAPRYVRGVINEQLKVLNSLQQPPIAAGSPTKSRETTFEGIMIDSIRSEERRVGKEC